MKYISKHLILVVVLTIILLCLYLYVKFEKFADPTPTLTLGRIDTQLTREIARVLGISQRRITNLIYAGDPTSNLKVSFTILERNLIESANDEIKTDDAITLYINLFSTNTFFVNINGNYISLSRNTATMPTNKGMYFDNIGLKTISKHANEIYMSPVPTDAVLVNFYKLGIDDKYNVRPKIIV